MRLAAFVARPMDIPFQLDGEVSRPKKVSPRRRKTIDNAEIERLMGTLEAALGGSSTCKIVVFASARAGEGKTTVVAALARHAAAQRGERVLVIDASANHDLARRLGGLPELGLQEAAATFAASARPGPGGPGEVIVVKASSGRRQDVGSLLPPEAVSLFRQSCDYVFVECPCFAQSPAVIASAKSFDGMVVVVEAGRTRWPVVQHLREQFEAAGGTVLGVVLNKRRYFVPRWLYRRL